MCPRCALASVVFWLRHCCKTLYSSSMAFVSYYHQLAPAFYMASYAISSKLHFTLHHDMLIVRSSIVPILGCSCHLHSSHRFLSTWGAVMLEKICIKKFLPIVYLPFFWKLEQPVFTGGLTCFLSCKLDTLILAFVSYCCIHCFGAQNVYSERSEAILGFN